MPAPDILPGGGIKGKVCVLDQTYQNHQMGQFEIEKKARRIIRNSIPAIAPGVAGVGWGVGGWVGGLLPVLTARRSLSDSLTFKPSPSGICALSP